jgi:hypothetical protein
MPGQDNLGGRCFPPIDDHLVTPETTRDEMVRGHRMLALPAKPPHAIRQAKLDFVIVGNVVPGYVAAVEMLTRVGEGSDFAADVAVLREGKDPATGERYLEELAFEVVSEQSMRDISLRAADLTNRGVRRVIAIFIKRGEVREWDRARNDWRMLPLDSELSDPTLVRPIPVRALLDSRVGDDAVVEGLDAKGNRAMIRIKATEHRRGMAEGVAEGIARGKAEGLAEGVAQGLAEGVARSILLVLDLRGLKPTQAQHETIMACKDEDRLSRWLAKATLVVASVDELLAIE